jgi:Tol biopolymer transport system component
VRRSAALLGLALVLAGCGGSGSSETTSNENGPIAYVVSPVIGQGISVRDPDGHRSRFTRNGRDIYPTWSPDGREIAFERGFGKQGASHLFVMNADGSGVHQVGDVATASGGPSWMPAGDEIVFDDIQGGISSIGVDGSGPRHIAAKAFNPTVSPDGKTIAFVRGPAIYAINADGSNAHALLEPPESSTSGKDMHLFTLREPQWMPDGDHLMFVKLDLFEVAKAKGGSTIEIVDAEGANERTVTKVFTVLPEIITPSPSPDGESIVFAGRRGETDGIWTVSVDGGEPQLLLENYKYAQPSWGAAGT